MIHGMLCFFLPSNLLGYPGEIAKSGDSGSVWKVFYFTAERQFDGLVQKELRFTQLHCLFWLHFFVMPEAKAGCNVNLIQTFCCPLLF